MKFPRIFEMTELLSFTVDNWIRAFWFCNLAFSFSFFLQKVQTRLRCFLMNEKTLLQHQSYHRATSNVEIVSSSFNFYATFLPFTTFCFVFSKDIRMFTEARENCREIKNDTIAEGIGGRKRLSETSTLIPRGAFESSVHYVEIRGVVKIPQHSGFNRASTFYNWILLPSSSFVECPDREFLA